MGEHSEPDAPPAAPPGWWGHLGELEPIRRALWPVAVAVVALLGGYGLLTGELALLWLGVLAALLGIGGAEVARSSAWAPESVRELRRGIARNVDDELELTAREAYARGVRDALARSPERVAAEVRQDDPMTVEHVPPTRAIPRAQRPPT